MTMTTSSVVLEYTRASVMPAWWENVFASRNACMAVTVLSKKALPNNQWRGWGEIVIEAGELTQKRTQTSCSQDEGECLGYIKVQNSKGKNAWAQQSVRQSSSLRKMKRGEVHCRKLLVLFFSFSFPSSYTPKVTFSLLNHLSSIPPTSPRGIMNDTINNLLQTFPCSQSLL